MSLKLKQISTEDGRNRILELPGWVKESVEDIQDYAKDLVFKKAEKQKALSFHLKTKFTNLVNYCTIMVFLYIK